jgi:hypothetical protein
VVTPLATIMNHRPTVTILGVQGKLSYTRSFATLAPPRPCGAYTRHWSQLARFRGTGRYTIAIRATDKSGLTSLPARRTFSHG